MRIEAQQLIKQYGRNTALVMPRLVIPAGQRVGLVGNNGAGKTTFLRLLLDLMRASHGSIWIDGKNVVKENAWKNETGSYLDESFLVDFLTPEEYFIFVGKVYGMTETEVERRLEPYTDFFNGEILGCNKYIRDLSLGNKKKVGIVGAMMLEPSLLILDEPFANLDPSTQLRLRKMLIRLNQRKLTTMIISSHDLNHVAEICDRIVILEKGSIVEDLKTSDKTLKDLEKHFDMDGVISVGVEQ